MNRNDYRAAMDSIAFRDDFQESTVKKLTAAAQKTRKESLPMNAKKMSRIIPIAAALAVVLAITAAAAVLLLRPSEVASIMNDKALAAAFESDGAVALNQTVESDGWNITLAGIVSGAGLSDFTQDVDTARTYAVLALQSSDGTALTEPPMKTVATPLISGYAPHAVNAWTLGGGYTAFVRDGIAYYLFDYQSLEMFADHTVYLAVYQGSTPSRDDFTMAEDGSIGFSDSYQGLHALFTLPMDASKADPAAVTQYFQEQGIDQLLNPAA